MTIRHVTIDRIPVDEGLFRLRVLCLTTHNTHKRLNSVPSAGFEGAIPVRERPHTYAIEGAATGIGNNEVYNCIFYRNVYTRIWQPSF
jgi:hypothetical protein